MVWETKGISPSSVVPFRSEVCVPALCQPHLRDGCRRGLLELRHVDRREGGDGQILPVALRDEGPGVLLQFQKCLQEELLLHRLLQQRDSTHLPRYTCVYAFTA